VIFSEARSREEYRDGMATITRTIKTPEFVYKWANIFSDTLEIRGAWFFQYKLNSESLPVLLEIGMRVAGASGITRLRGVNLSLLNMHLFCGENNDLKVI